MGCKRNIWSLIIFMKNIIEKKSFLKNVYAKYSLLFCLLVPLCFFQFFVYGKSFLVHDGLNEHTAFLAFYGQWLRNIVSNIFHGKFTIPTFSFSLGFGADVISTLNWFCVGDPLNLFSVFVPKECSYVLFVVLAVIRLYLMGIAFIVFCRKKTFFNASVVFGALAYAFCGYAIFVGLRHPYFLNPMIYFPLLCLGIDFILEKKSPLLFIITVFISCACNYYFFYMLSIFVFIYAIVRFFFVEKSYGNSKKLNAFIKVFLKTVGFYFIGVALASFIFLPNIYGFLTASRTTEKIIVPLLYDINYYANLFFSPSAPSSFGSYGNLGFAAPILLFVVFLFTQKDSVSKQLKIFLLIGFLFFLIPFLAHVTNGFNYITNRWSFAFALPACVSFVHIFPKFCSASKKDLKLPMLITAVHSFIILAACFLDKNIRQQYFVCYAFSLLFLFFSYILLKKNKNAFLQKFICISIFLGIIINSNIRFSPNGLNYLEKYTSFGSYEKNLNANTDFEIKKLSDKYFFRYDEEGKFTANNSAIFGTSGTNYYYSISDIYLMQLYEELCLATTNNMRCSSLNRRSALQKLFAVKYFVLPTKTEYIPEYMTFVKEFDTYAGKKKLYRLNNSLPFAVPYKNVLYADKNFENLNPIEKQELFLAAAVVYDEKSKIKNEENEIKLNSKILHKSISFIENNDVKIEVNKITTKKKNATFEIDFAGEEDSDSRKELYLLFKNFYYTTDNEEHVKPKITFVADSGKKESFSFELTSSNDSMGHNRMPCFGLQDCESGKFFVTLENKGVYEFDEISVFALDISERDKKFNSRYNDEISSLTFAENKISLETSLKERQFVRFSMPYSKGWKIFIDGRETKSYRCDIAFIGTFVESGNHSVVLKYSTPFLNIGLVVSLLGLIILIVLCFCQKSRRKENE